MPIPDMPGIGMEANLDQVKDYLIGLRRWANDFLNHLDSLNVDELTADIINTGTLNAALVIIKALNGSKYFQFDQNGIVANNGSVDTLKFDLATGLLTIVSALIQSATGYPRVELNSSGNLFAAYSDANNSVRVTPQANTTPGVAWYAAGSVVATLDHVLGSGMLFSSFGGSEHLSLRPAGNVKFDAWSRMTNINTGNTLQQDLDAKANAFSGYTGSVSVITSVDFAGSTTTSSTLNFSNGVLTSVS